MGIFKFIRFLLVFICFTGYIDAKQYRVVSSYLSADSHNILIQLVDNIEEYGPNIERLLISVSYETKDRLHMSITDAKRTRWEVPYNLIPRINSNHFVNNSNIKFVYTINPFSFKIIRVSNAEVLFDYPASSRFIFKDQYLEISTRIPQGASLFGLGESTRSAGLKLVPNSTYTLWTSDTGAAMTDINLYGSHPFYIDVRKHGNTHGVLLLNSNGMDIIYSDGLITYKVIGGIFDFYFFAGPSPLSVMEQYTQVVGRPAPMPYWSLGFHQCRWGYRNVSQLHEVVNEYKKADLPLEVMWADIDHMDGYKDFTLDPVNFPQQQMKAFIGQLHRDGQRFVLIVDPGIKPDINYATYKRAKAFDIFIKDLHGKSYLGQVWPGPTHFPDFLHPNIEAFWTQEISIFHKMVPFDGLWIDMNEVSNFCTGTTCSLPPKNVTCPSPTAFTQCCLICSDKSTTRWDDPPYKINNGASQQPLRTRTIPPSATHYNGILVYNAHNLYGFSESIITNLALKKVLKRRPFILSRSTFVGSGRVAAHWTGDNAATWNDLRYSITSILNSGIAGIPMVGADICGFGGDTTEELCNRWIQLGAFYPFSRNHNSLGSKPQELYRWKTVIKSAKTALKLRYRLLPYLYTLTYQAHKWGSPLARPLFFEFADDPQALSIDTQFLLGRGLLVSPVLIPNTTRVYAYFPKGTWYNLFDYTKFIKSHSGKYVFLDAPWDSINVHIRDGCIIPMQEYAKTTKLVRQTPFTLIVAFQQGVNKWFASGELYIDDDDEFEMKEGDGLSTLVKFNAVLEDGKVYVNAFITGGENVGKKGAFVGDLVVLGGRFKITKLVFNGKEQHGLRMKQFETGVKISGLSVSLVNEFQLLLEV